MCKICRPVTTSIRTKMTLVRAATASNASIFNQILAAIFRYMANLYCLILALVP